MCRMPSPARRRVQTRTNNESRLWVYADKAPNRRISRATYGDGGARQPNDIYSMEISMTKRVLIALVLAGGACVTLGGMSRASQAQQVAALAAPKAYYVAEFELKDPEALRPYSENVVSTFTPFGGQFIARGGRILALEGEGPGARTVIIEFPSLERAQAWYDSPAYRELRPYRQKSGISRTYIIEGMSN
jgi:uncharacterized protein (DUF1330 family)